MGLNTSIENIGSDISQTRLEICRKCPLYKSTTYGPVCNSKLWVNTTTGEISNSKKPGYKNGCGCMLNNKTKLSYTSCPLSKW